MTPRGGSAVIGRAWRIQSDSVAVDRPLDVLRRPARRPRSAAPRGRSLPPAWRPIARLGPPPRSCLPVPDDPLVARDRARDQPIAQPLHRGQEARCAVAGDRIGGEDHAGGDGEDHPLNDHRHAAIGVALVIGDVRGARAGQAALDGRAQVIGRDTRARSRTCPQTNVRRRPRRSRSTERRTGPDRAPTCRRRRSSVAPIRVSAAASIVITTPSGTRTPAANSSPRLAALPPTSAASDMRTSRRRRTTAALTERPPIVPQRWRRAGSSRRHPPPGLPIRRGDHAMCAATDWEMRTTSSRVIRSRSALESGGSIDSASRRILAKRAGMVACLTSSAIGLA